VPFFPEIAIIGAGRVAQSLGRALRESGMPSAVVVSRSPEGAAKASAFIGGAVVAPSLLEAAQHAERVVIAVSDAAVASVAKELAANPGRLTVALHTCGNAGAELLAPLAERGVSCGAIHPLQTIHEPESGARALRGIAFAISGDAAALDFAGEIVTCLGGQALRIPAGAHPLYHAAAVMASNYITTMLDAAVDTLSHVGIPVGPALQALAPLARAAVENAAQSGPLQALTGPVARGDVSTVAAHVRALGEVSEPLLDLYRAVGARTLDMARRRGLPEAAAHALSHVLEAGK
jgi:predicted short-subunit dehydrogenase-like oxidoreductase (DUF2520 family)